MTSPRRKQGSPIESVTLEITFEGTRKELSRIKEAIPSAVVRRGRCDVTLRAEGPKGLAEKAKELLGRLRAVGPSKGFKKRPGSLRRN